LIGEAETGIEKAAADVGGDVEQSSYDAAHQ
jgi:hypothetical protein